MWEKMYGDCQVMPSSMGGGGSGISSESLFSSPIRNPNFDFLSNLPFSAFATTNEENGLMRGKEEMESGGSGSEHLEEKSITEQELGEGGEQPPNKKKRYHRHTARQIQEMEALFKECPHPDDKQRIRLSQDLGLKPRQVKFWFQNRRTQMKAQQDRAENATLRAENDNLKNENYRLQAALRNIVCPNCGGSGVLGEMGFDEQLRIENVRLKDELEKVCCITSRYTGQGLHPMQQPPHSSLLPPSLDLDMNIFPRHFQVDPTMITAFPEIMPIPMMPECPSGQQVPEPISLMLTEEDKSHAMELAVSSMDELIKMCHANDPLWIKSNENGREMLNFKEYSRLFPNYNNGSYNKQGGDKGDEFEREASRDSAVIIMNSITLVDAFLDANKWMELFPSIVSRAKNIQVLAMGVAGNASGSLHLMYAEFQVVSPLIPTRETYFLRYCHQNAEEGTWAIVDFPIDNIFHDNLSTSFPRYRRKPSGCVIQDMPNGYSRVTWLEHGEIEEKSVHPLFSNLVNNGIAFGAHRWLAILQRQCERVASLMARNISDLGVIPSPEARRNLMRLSQRMIRTFSANMSNSGGQSWTAVVDSFDDTVRITTRKVNELGQPHGTILAAASTTWLPYQHYQVFELLKDERRRSQLDMLSNGNALHEVAHIANGSHPGNSISLLRINVASNSSQHVELMLQESCTDQSGSLVVFSTVDVESIQLAMNGEDPSSIPLLPIGFSMVPAPSAAAAAAAADSDHLMPLESGGCLLTVGLQVLLSPIPNAKLNISSVTAITNHLGNMVHQISTVLCSSGDSGAAVMGGGGASSSEGPIEGSIHSPNH